MFATSKAGIVMGERETKESARIVTQAQKDFPGLRLFRNSTGYCPATRIKYGLVPGSADLIGWAPVKITPDMIGKTVAVFLSVEVKAKDKNGKYCAIQENQKTWARNVTGAGGVALILEEGQDVVIE